MSKLFVIIRCKAKHSESERTNSGLFHNCKTVDQRFDSQNLPGLTRIYHENGRNRISFASRLRKLYYSPDSMLTRSSLAVSPFELFFSSISRSISNRFFIDKFVRISAVSKRSMLENWRKLWKLLVTIVQFIIFIIILNRISLKQGSFTVPIYLLYLFKLFFHSLLQVRQNQQAN